VPAELVAVAEDRDLQGVQRVGATVEHLLAQDRRDERGQVAGLVQPPDGSRVRDQVVGDGLLGRVLQQRARVVAARGVVGRLEVDGVALVARPGPAGQPVRLRDHLADRSRGEEAGHLGDPAVMELVPAVADQVAKGLAVRLVDRVSQQVDNVPVLLRLAGSSHVPSISADSPLGQFQLLVVSISIPYAQLVRDRWTGLELRYLVTLAAVGREASFSRAADALGYTQSAVSQQISRLEHITGTRLVERPGGPRPVSLTPAGLLLAGHAEAIGARLASAAADLEALARGTAGLLRVGCYQSVGARLLPPVLREFTAAWPQVEVQLSETQDDGELLADLEGGRLDLTFVVFPPTQQAAEREQSAARLQLGG
jgi:hypothetical protein